MKEGGATTRREGRNVASADAAARPSTVQLLCQERRGRRDGRHHRVPFSLLVGNGAVSDPPRKRSDAPNASPLVSKARSVARSETCAGAPSPSPPRALPVSSRARHGGFGGLRRSSLVRVPPRHSRPRRGRVRRRARGSRGRGPARLARGPDREDRGAVGRVPGAARARGGRGRVPRRGREQAVHHHLARPRVRAPDPRRRRRRPPDGGAAGPRREALGRPEARGARVRRARRRALARDSASVRRGRRVAPDPQPVRLLTVHPGAARGAELAPPHRPPGHVRPRARHGRLPKGRALRVRRARRVEAPRPSGARRRRETARPFFSRRRRRRTRRTRRRAEEDVFGGGFGRSGSTAPFDGGGFASDRRSARVGPDGRVVRVRPAPARAVGAGGDAVDVPGVPRRGEVQRRRGHLFGSS